MAREERALCRYMSAHGFETAQLIRYFTKPGRRPLSTCTIYRVLNNGYATPDVLAEDIALLSKADKLRYAKGPQVRT